MIEIWQPRYKDNRVLIAAHKVEDGVNEIIFTKAKHLEGVVFTIEGDEIRSCPLESNGKIDCYSVPLSRLKRSSVRSDWL